MDNRQLMDAVGGIRSEYIEKYAIVKRRGTGHFRKWLLPVAACFLLAVTAVGFSFWFGDREENAVTGDTVMVVENGVLLAYTGGETEVTIPDTVTRIAKTAFSAPGAENIRTVTIGRGTAEIDSEAMYSLTGLSDIRVSRDNAYLAVTDGMLYRLDGTQVFNIARNDLDGNALFLLLNSLDTDPTVSGRTAQVVFGKAVLTVACEPTDAFSDDGRVNCCRIKRIRYHDKELELDDPFYGNNEIGFLCDEADGILVYTHTDSGKYIFMQDAVKKVPEPLSSDPNGSVYDFGWDLSDKRISYTRMPRKYTAVQEYYSILAHCVSKDEFYLEKGYLCGNGGTVSFCPTGKYTLREKLKEVSPFHLDLSEMFDSLKQSDFPGLAEFATLDDLLRYNSSRYEAAE